MGGERGGASELRGSAPALGARRGGHGGGGRGERATGGGGRRARPAPEPQPLSAGGAAGRRRHRLGAAPRCAAVGAGPARPAQPRVTALRPDAGRRCLKAAVAVRGPPRCAGTEAVVGVGIEVIIGSAWKYRWVGMKVGTGIGIRLGLRWESDGDGNGVQTGMEIGVGRAKGEGNGDEDEKTGGKGRWCWNGDTDGMGGNGGGERNGVWIEMQMQRDGDENGIWVGMVMRWKWSGNDIGLGIIQRWKCEWRWGYRRTQCTEIHSEMQMWVTAASREDSSLGPVLFLFQSEGCPCHCCTELHTLSTTLIPETPSPTPGDVQDIPTSNQQCRPGPSWHIPWPYCLVHG